MEQLAAEVGVSWQTIQQWENGKTAPKRLRAESVAHALGITVSELVYGTSLVTSGEIKTPDTLRSFPDRRRDDHPVITEVIRLMLEMDDIGKGRLLERATVIAEQHAKANRASSSQ